MWPSPAVLQCKTVREDATSELINVADPQLLMGLSTGTESRTLVGQGESAADTAKSSISKGVFQMRLQATMQNEIADRHQLRCTESNK